MIKLPYENGNIFKKDSIHVEFIRIRYDVEKAVRAIEKSDLPHNYVHMLKKAN